MILGPTIEHLRSYCPPFAGRVAGAADFKQGLEKYNATMPLPAAYVLPAEQDGEDGNENMVGYFQIVKKTVEVVVELNATGDRRGQTPAMQYDDIEAALFAAMLNWAPVGCRVPNMQGYQFLNGGFLDLDRARLFYAWRFLLPYQLTELDGWNPDGWNPDGTDPDGVPLNTIELDVFHAPVSPGDLPPAVVQIPTGDPPYPDPTDGPWPDPAATTRAKEMLQ
jgi:hypothetical protein